MFSRKQNYPGRSDASSGLATLRDNDYFRVVLMSFMAAVIMTLSTFGIYGMIKRKELPIPDYGILLFFAFIFIILFVYFDKKQVNKIGSTGLGFVAAGCLTVILTATLECLKILIDKGFSEIGITVGLAVTVLALAMIISALLIRTLADIGEKL